MSTVSPMREIHYGPLETLLSGLDQAVSGEVLNGQTLCRLSSRLQPRGIARSRREHLGCSGRIVRREC